MTQQRIVPVILSGGSGSRLWPLSRRLLPKQFLPLATHHTLIQDTALRLDGIEGCGAPLVICNHEHRFLAAEQLAEIGVRPRAMVLEPVGRNTAAAIAAAAVIVEREHPGAILLVLPSDHEIRDDKAFQHAVRAACGAAEAGFLVTFGVTPTAPATGYGYIECGAAVPDIASASRISRFVEKPDARGAERLIAQGNVLWNSGMFMFGARRIVDELREHCADILTAVERAVAGAAQDLDFLRLDAEAFSAARAESIDRAVMERTAAGAVVKANMRWSDLGSWSALWEAGAQDESRNVTHGDATLADTSGCYVRSEGRHVAVLGVRDLVIVETDDAVLVAPRERAQEVREVVDRLASENRSEHVSHRRVYRPWGYYENVDAGERFQVKRLMVKPGHALSLQRHSKRAEHWVVVSGTARVTRGEEVLELAENQSTFIPLGVRHRLENAADRPLFIIEVQSGSYLGEDDIERFEDRYNRR